MTTVEKQIELRNNKKTYSKLIEFKKQKYTELVVMQNNTMLECLR